MGNIKIAEGYHYILRCKQCDFVHHIPGDTYLHPIDYSVDTNKVKLICLFAKQFTLSLRLKGFFTLEAAPNRGETLHVSIRDNIIPLHEHLMTHYDPLYLVIKQTPTSTFEEFSIKPGKPAFVKFANFAMPEMHGHLDPNKAEIPGISC